MIKQTGHQFNERVDLPTIKPLTRVRKVVGRGSAAAPSLLYDLPVLGIRLDVKERSERSEEARFADGRPREEAEFADGKPASITARYGRGTVFAVGFMPGLAYSPFKVGQTTLDEEWPWPPRWILNDPLQEAGFGVPMTYPAPEPPAVSYWVDDPARVPGPIEASLLTGPEGSAIVLVNHSYKPIPRLHLRLPSIHSFREARSTEGVPVKWERRVPPYAVLELPLKWTDIILLPKDAGTNPQPGA